MRRRRPEVHADHPRAVETFRRLQQRRAAAHARCARCLRAAVAVVVMPDQLAGVGVGGGVGGGVGIMSHQTPSFR